MSFLKVHVIGFIVENGRDVTKVTPTEELLLVSGIRRLVPLVSKDLDSACVLTITSDVTLPRARFVLSESYREISERLAAITI